MATLWVYPIFLVITFSLSLIYIPQKDYKEYLIYGFLLGGLGDMIVVGLLQDVFHVAWFKNQGLFKVMDQNFLSPPAGLLQWCFFSIFYPEKE